MDTWNRRSVLGGAALAGTAVAAAAVANATPAIMNLKDLKKEADVACLYHCDFGDLARFGQMLNNVANHYSVYGSNPFDVQLAIVTHGPGVKFFMDSLEGSPWKDEATAIAPTVARIDALSKSGLKIYMCDITFTRLNLDRAKARKADFISFVPSGVATVAALQSKGFAYLKVG
jgi:uncharacterized protein